jgi:trehalose-6-phosphatase
MMKYILLFIAAWIVANHGCALQTEIGVLKEQAAKVQQLVIQQIDKRIDKQVETR